MTQRLSTQQLSRRNFMAASGIAGLGALMGGYTATRLVASNASADGTPAILGGTPLSEGSVPSWPILQGDEEKFLLEVLKSGRWFRGSSTFKVSEFENIYAKMNGAKHCIATNSGTSSLINTLAALDVGPGDEVITSPYTFIATINCILAHYAVPVVADVDLESFQVDAAKADAACTDNTAVLLPVHIGGSPADLDAFLEIGTRRKLPVVEDACQAHIGKWRDKYLGAVGTAGCFSFQVTKNLACGDGGAVLTSDDALADKIYACHNNSTGGRPGAGYNFGGYRTVRSRNNRMVEFAGAVLCAQSVGIEKYAETRQENAMYLNKLLSEIPGVVPAKLYPGTTRSAWHLYMFRIEKDKFGLDRNTFCKAMNAEKIEAWTGYGAENWMEYTKKVYSTRSARRLYSEKFLDDLAERVGELPNYKRLCSEAVWFGQPMLLGPKKNMDIIADAIRRIQKNAAAIRERS